jgi:phosphoserine phosphatase
MPGEVSVKDVKARRVHEHINGKAIDYAYGDTTSDIPLLELAAHPTAVHPDSSFRKIAAQRGWRIIE